MNLRKTKQKKVIEEVINDLNNFFTAEEVYEIVRKIDSNIGLATIYRYLNSLKKMNSINTYYCDRKILYSKEKRSHCHYVCEKSGKIIHFDLDSLDFLKKVKEKIPGSITSFQLEIKGICDDCNRK